MSIEDHRRGQVSGHHAIGRPAARLYVAGLWLVGAGLLLVPAQGAAATGERHLALFFYVKDEQNRQVSDAIESLLRELAREIPSVDVVEPREAWDAPALVQESHYSSCGARLACLVTLGKRTGADEILFGRTVALPQKATGALFQLIVVETLNSRILRKAAIEIATPEAVESAVLSHWAEIFGIRGEGQVEIPGYTGPVEIRGTVVGVGAGPHVLGAGPQRVRVKDHEERVLILPGQISRLDLGEKAPVASEDPASPIAGTTGQEEIVASGAEPGASTPVVAEELPAPWLRKRLLTWGGIATGAAGVAMLGVGSYYGLSSRSAASDASSLTSGGQTRATQLEVERLNRRAADSASRANLLLGLGGALVVVGAGLVAIDLWFVDTDSSASVVVVGTGQGIVGGARVTW